MVMDVLGKMNGDRRVEPLTLAFCPKLLLYNNHLDCCRCVVPFSPIAPCVFQRDALHARQARDPAIARHPCRPTA
ncbi:hypothetical protein XFF6166_1060039 [Xanthomonas citri pv. fuscans]|nr:hypothetical protein XFF6166_1060039 [Xanthomonas citri pv. fuscans]SON98305.1 hypothetical protein XFF7767_1020005 [Xanthomonas citri pv. fuscans]SOO04073.1 hypothetical protein XFF6960_930003 [Xanthomonas citri pv. fuscans]SOO11533.1 hypothetical protein XFF6970_890038 [Xanthomonas citri pv. fuscans]SOO16068.1 hypothetical protein XFF7766_730019 [Xanthomonas citri pv. fuscans]